MEVPGRSSLYEKDSRLHVYYAVITRLCPKQISRKIYLEQPIKGGKRLESKQYNGVMCELQRETIRRKN